MVLAPCPECGKQVSTRASACPQCGCPISADSTDQKHMLDDLRPKLAEDLSIGRQCVNWSGDSAVKGYCDIEENPAVGLTSGNVNLLCHKRGVRLVGKSFTPIRDLHFSQILDIQYAESSRIYENDKSVVKRAAVGGLILGPLGAVIGGLTGVGKKSHKFKGYIVINYWDVEKDYPLTIMIALNDEKQAIKFCEKVSKEL